MDTVRDFSDGATTWVDATEAWGVQVGSHNVQHNHIGYTPPIVRSAYLEQVRRIAPSDLKDRGAELADLAAFCTDDSEFAYAWWLAPAWAGKSALMSWFVLHPPPGVRIVSFFVTARHDRQNDRKAFVDNLLEQLAELLAYRGLPAGLTDATGDAHLARMLDAATVKCQQAGERLVLVLDGLDEDRGVTVGPESYSIAAALPRRPPGGLKIVVSSRPDPPLPQDVPLDHPLRGQCVERELAASAHAEVVRVDADRELKKILLDGGVGLEVLGLVTAAGSGLAVCDLAELAGADQWLVEDHLASYTGRTFARADALYVLAHEELQSTSARLLGAARLRRYGQRLHDWADRYRRLGWPGETPTYLLRGYFRMLCDQGETARMVLYAADAARHDRMLDDTGGDADAHEEISLAQAALLACSETDLASMCRLALRRADLDERNTNLPLTLPRLWAAVGNVARAEALARSIPEEGNRRAVALIFLAPEVAAAGHHERAELLLGLMPDQVFVDADQPGKVVSEVVRRIAGGGDYDRATVLARRIDAPFWQSRAYCEIVVAQGFIDGGRAEAEATTARIPMSYWRAQALAVLAREAARRETSTLAERLANSAESLADTLEDGPDRALVHAVLANQAKTWRGADHASRLAALAVEEASALDQPDQRVDTATKILPQIAGILSPVELTNLAEEVESALREAYTGHQIPLQHRVPRLFGAAASLWYAAGDFDRAVAVATSLDDPSSRQGALLKVVEAAAAAGDLVRARALADSFADPPGRDRALGRIVTYLADDISNERIAGVVDAIQDTARHASALADWGYRATKRGDLETATELARRAEAGGRAIGDPGAKAKLLTALACALIAAGRIELARAAVQRAATAYRLVPEQVPSKPDVIKLVHAADRAGDYRTAAVAAELLGEPFARARAQTDLASSIAHQGHHDIAMEILGAAETSALSISHQRRRLQTMREIMTVLWIIGENAGAEALAVRMVEREDVIEPVKPMTPVILPQYKSTTHAAIEAAHHAPSAVVARERDQALAKAAEAATSARDFARAESLSNLMMASWWRTQARISLIKALARAGHFDRALALANADDGSQRPGRLLRELADVLADQRAIEQAERVARSIDDPYDRDAALIALAHKAEPPKAQDLLLEPVRHGKLPQILELVASVSPEALDAIANHLLAEDPPAQAAVCAKTW